MSTIQTVHYKSPIGMLRIIGDGSWIYSVEFADEDQQSTNPHSKEEMKHLSTPIRDCLSQLDEYFTGTRTEFSLPLSPRGTPFQKKVWKQLQMIPYGETRSYKEMAEAIDSPRAMRAVGGANGKNPLTIVIPCHRVIAHDGSMGGYGGGIDRKEWLLEHERCNQKQECTGL